MQSWPNQGQSGADDHNVWQSSFGFPNQDGQFDQNQAWSQPIPDQAFGRQLNPADASPNFLHDPHAMLSGYQDGHGSFDLGSQFPAQDVIDPAFHSSMQGDIFSHQNKLSIGEESLNHMSPVQGHPHAHNHAFNHADYNSFTQQPDQQQYGSSSQYSQPQLMQQMSRQQSHTPVQQFNTYSPNNFAQQLRPAQHPSPTQQQEIYSQNANLPVTQANGHNPQYHVHTGQQQHQPSYSPSTFAPSKTYTFQQHQGSPGTAFSQAVPSPAESQHPRPIAPGGTEHDATASLQQSVEIENSATPPVISEPTTAKRRARVTKTISESPAPPLLPEGALHQPVPAGVSEPSVRKIEDIDSFTAPEPSHEDLQTLHAFHRRPKTAQAKFPAIKGLPYLASDTSIKLPAPKSYDKLAPLVALPPRSSKALVPELEYDLPSEVQGRFTNQYRPAFDKIGLDERRIEAKALLDDFDRSMKALGKRRPKYTEYPHAFKEQLKSDEASKSKAEKKAKKELEEERNKPLRAAVRPTDPVEAAVWDTIGTVHFDQSATKSSSIVAERVRQAGDIFIKLRGEMNQAKQEVDQAIKEQKPEAQLTSLKADVEKKKEALYRALDATLEHADDSVLDNLGGHQKLITSLVNILITSIKTSDFSGKLAKIVLELFTHFPMTKKIAETTNFDTVRKRFADKGDDEVKQLVKEISAKVKKVLKSSEGESVTGYTGTSAASRATKVSGASGKVASAGKRVRDDDPSSADARVVKKIAVEPGSSSLSRKLAQPKLQLQSASKTTAAKAAAASIQMDKTRPVAKPAAKPAASGGDSPSVSTDDNKTEPKKASTKADASKAAPVKTETKPPAPKMGAAPSSSVLSGIASLLDSINAPRPVTPPTAAKDIKEPDVNETAEEKAKRLRKEARRKLRVTWKPDSELVQTRIFEKVDGEDSGRDVNMIRDAADDRAEGMMLKQGMSVEEEEDDDDIPYQPWTEPMDIDFSNLSEETRKKNYVNRGGTVAFKTQEQDFISQREQRELMAIYADVADMPETPKSPPAEHSISYEDPKVGNLPVNESKFEEIGLRWRDEQQMGIDGALYNATQRLNAKSGPSQKLDSALGLVQNAASQATSSSHTRAMQGSDFENVPLVAGGAVAEQVLGWLRSEHAKRWQDPSPVQVDSSRDHHYNDPAVEIVGRALESLAKGLETMPFPATAPPRWMMADEERASEWWQGHYREVAAKQKRAEEELARSQAERNAALQASGAVASGQGQAAAQDWSAYYAQQQAAYAPYMALLQQANAGQSQPAQSQPTAQGSQQLDDSQLQSILAAMNQSQGQAHQQQQAQPAAAANYLNPNDPSYQQLMMLTQMAQDYQSQNSGENRDHGRDQDWDRDGHDRYGRDRHDDHGRDRDFRGGKHRKDKKPGPTTIHKPPNAALIGTKPCSFWQAGKCARGDKCTFRHD